MFFDAVRNSKTQTEWDKESDYRERNACAPVVRTHINSSKQKWEKENIKKAKHFQSSSKFIRMLCKRELSGWANQNEIDR